MPSTAPASLLWLDVTGVGDRCQVGWIALAAVACLCLIALTANEVDKGNRWHRQSLQAAKHLSEDTAHLVPLLYTAGVEPLTFEHGGNLLVGDEGGAPIDQWLSGLGGERQAAAAQRDVAKLPTAMVHLPGRPDTLDIVKLDNERQSWGTLDFEQMEAEQMVRATTRNATRNHSSLSALFLPRVGHSLIGLT